MTAEQLFATTHGFHRLNKIGVNRPRAGDIPGAEDQGKRGDIPEEEDRWQGHRLQGQMGGGQSADKARSPPPGLPNGETVHYINTTTSSS